MSAIAFPSGTRVQAILLDEGRTELPGMVGMVVPVSEWPASFPEAWTEENTVIVRWDAEDGRKPFTPYRSDVANRVLRVLAAPAPTDPSTGAVTPSSPAPVDDATPSLVELDRKDALVHEITELLYTTPFPDLGWKPEPGQFASYAAAAEHLARLIAAAVTQ